MRHSHRPSDDEIRGVRAQAYPPVTDAADALVKLIGYLRGKKGFADLPPDVVAFADACADVKKTFKKGQTR